MLINIKIHFDEIPHASEALDDLVISFAKSFSFSFLLHRFKNIYSSQY